MTTPRRPVPGVRVGAVHAGARRDQATRLLAGAGVEQPVKVLVVTTFNLGEYVYEALRAGASGFLLKDAPPARLLHGIRTVATGAALLDPQVTRRLWARTPPGSDPRRRPPATFR